MKILVLVIVGVIGAIVLLACVAALIGSRLSKSHTATRSIFLRQSPQNVYGVIRDFPSAPVGPETSLGPYTTRREGPSP
jgi:hypothetical protein